MMVTYYPTLIIGLGGTGTKVALRVKKMIRESSEANSSLQSFLFIDTDLASFSQMEGLPAIEKSEQSLIGVKHANTLLSSPKTNNPSVFNRFPSKLLNESYIRRLSAGVGAGQIRSLGALAFQLSYDHTREAILNSLRKVTTLDSNMIKTLTRENTKVNPDQVVIYIIGSLAGGTGSGCFLDAAIIASDICSKEIGKTPRIVGCFALPSIFHDVVSGDPEMRNAMQSNTYTALKELQYVLDAEDRQNAISYKYGGTATHKLEPGNQLFNLTYLFDNRNTVGSLPSPENLYELIARTIFQDVGTKFGAEERSFESNVKTLTGTSRCPQTNKTRFFSSGAVSVLSYPADRVRKYCACNTITEVINDEFITKTIPTNEIKNKVSTFLSSNNLDDRGRSNQILQKLLQEGGDSRKTQTSMSSATHGMRPDWGQRYNDKEFITRVQAKREEFLKIVNNDVAGIVSENFENWKFGPKTMRKDVISDTVIELALQTAANDGMGATIKVLDELTVVAKFMKDELGSELNEWRNKKQKEAESSFNEACTRLSRLSIPDKLRGRGPTFRANLISTFNNCLNNEFEALAKPHSANIAEHLESCSRNELMKWTRLASCLDSVAKDFEKTARQLEKRSRGKASDFCVEVDITQPGYEARHYESNRKSTGDALAVIAGHAISGSSEKSEKKLSAEDMKSFYMLLLDIIEKPDAPARVTDLFYSSVAGPVWGHLLNTDIVDFIKRNPNEVGGQLDQKLRLVFDMCEPFWSVRSIAANMIFPEFAGIAFKHEIGDDGIPVVPDMINNWMESHSSGNYAVIPSSTPYELSISRRVHGARAFYLEQAKDWQESYKQEQSRSQGKYMISSHVDLEIIPDLIPQDTKPTQMFALGIALGFVAARGDWYYFNMIRKSDNSLVVEHASKWETIDSIESVPGIPSPCGNLVFSRRQTQKIADKFSLGQGREASINRLAESQEYTDLLTEAVNEYRKVVGNKVFKEQFQGYVNLVLQPKIDNTPGSSRASSLKTEMELIEDYLATLDY